MLGSIARRVLVMIGCAAATLGCPAEPESPSTCGVQGATQACVCTDGSSAGQVCQGDGTWSACSCGGTTTPQCSGTPPCSGHGECQTTATTATCLCEAGWIGEDCGQPEACLGVTCLNGGLCDASLACDCPPGTFGTQCGARCESSALAVEGCTTLLTPGQWYAADGSAQGLSSCGQAHRFSVALGAAQPGQVQVAVTADPASETAFYGMADGDGDGIWTSEVLLEAGTTWYYVFWVEGQPQTDPGVPVDPQSGFNTLELAPCAADTEPNLCGRLFDSQAISVNCDAGGAGCSQGAVSNYWFGLALRAPAAVSRLRFRSDWWSKRPEAWELWASDRADVNPDNGARLVASGSGKEYPWQCVTGESCVDPQVPEECCPNGRDEPQQIPEGKLISKWESHDVDHVPGQFFFFRVVSSRESAQLYMASVVLEGHQCLETGGIFPAEPDCIVGTVGTSGGCATGQWCSPAGDLSSAVPGCVPFGEELEGGSCATSQECEGQDCPASIVCQAGLICAGDPLSGRRCVAPCDPAAPVCPAGTPRCAPVTVGDASMPYGTCKPELCESPFGTAECKSGTWCRPGFLSGEPSPICAQSGPSGLGEPCGDTECAPNLMCLSGHCRTLCDSDGAFPAAPACGASTECVSLFGGLGGCYQGCEYGTAGTCPTGEHCAPVEQTSLAIATCRYTPEHWPSDEGFAPLSECDEPSQPCGPFDGCFSGEEGTPTVCFPKCRTSEGDFGAGHPDCPPEASVCVNFGDSAYGVCTPP